MKNVDRGFDLGSKQALILEMVVRCGRDAYGAEICRELEGIKQRTALPQIYGALDKLERAGLVRSRMGEPTSERGGRRKRVYSITGLGQAALSAYGGREFGSFDTKVTV
ncbi:MAG: PadR family transcriptional regulator [Pseudomonadota bacterium]